MSEPIEKRRNPYVGPRAFQAGEKLYGRDREVLDLLDLMIAERVVLLHSPSGAGKTSLIQAKLLGRLADEAFEVLPILRVNQDVPPRTQFPQGANRYLLSAMLILEQSPPNQARLNELARMSLAEYLDKRAQASSSKQQLALIFDQFEEILTLDSTDQEAKKRFFEELGHVLRNQDRWALFAMREEFLAGLDPYTRLIPTRFKTRFRLDLLGEGAAMQAIQMPAQSEAVNFPDEAAQLLVNDLRTVQVQTMRGVVESRLGPYIEPVELQVVCERLWTRLPDGCAEISATDVNNVGNVNTALSDYYEEKVSIIARQANVRERIIREWFDRELITENGIRSQVLQGVNSSRGLDNAAISKLIDAHLVRGEQRLGGTWYELAHDRLIEPIRARNAQWYKNTLSDMQIQADIWARKKRPDSMLLRDDTLQAAEAWAGDHGDILNDIEKDFLTACRKERAVLKLRHRQTIAVRWLALALFIALSAVSYIVYDARNSIIPWGYLRDLESGSVIKLSGNWVSVGRTSGEIKNTVSIDNGAISRMHLFVDRDKTAIDMRSLNGTTINAKRLLYGYHHKLADNDVIVLAGLKTYQFESVHGSPLDLIEKPSGVFPPNGTWSILVDSKTRKISYLKEDHYWLQLSDDGGALLSSTKTDSALLFISRYENSSDYAIEDKDDGSPLYAEVKEGDYTVISCPLQAGRRYEYIDAKALRLEGNCTYLSHREYDETHVESFPLSMIIFRYGNTNFQIVPISPPSERSSQ